MSRFTDNERQRTDEAAHVAATIQAAHKAEEERQKGQKVQEENARISSLHAVQIVLEGKSGTNYCFRQT